MKTNCKTFFLLFLLIYFFTFSGGCATVPKVADVIQEFPRTDEPPIIISSKGPLSPKESRALIEHLKRAVGPTDILGRHIVIMEYISGRPLIKGNKVTLLRDGPATYDAMFNAIEKATDNINFETFIIEDDEIGRGFADLLLQKQSEGVQVNLIYDSVGSFDTSKAFFQRLRDGGINVLEFNPINPFKARKEWLINYRDHRKIVIVDGKVAITGGVNISQVYSSRLFDKDADENLPKSWRDTDIQIEGPAVAELQRLFLDTWQRQNGPKLSERTYFPALTQEGNDLVRVIGSTPGEMNRLTFVMYVSAIAYADKFIYLTSAYFVPDEQMVKALSDAAERGVDVKIILPGSSDISLAFYTGRYYYSPLLKAGVKLYERRNAMVHAKTAVIDSVWSTVGSTNLDFWSFVNNDEVNVVILSPEFATKMEELFMKDLEESNQIKLEEWEERPLFSRLREWFAHLFAHWL